MAEAKRDQNHVPSIIGVSSADGVTPVVVYADPTTHRLLVDIGGGFTSPLTTKGDLHTYTTTDARLGVGTDGQVLVADSAEATGLKWATIAGTGDVVGPASATDNAIARFDTTTGKLIQNSAVTIADTTGNMAGVGTLNTHTIPGGTSTFALQSDNLSVFAATTSAQLAGVISDETGSGALVFGTSPTIGGPLTYTNAGAGADPTLASNAATQVLALTGQLTASGGVDISASTDFSIAGTAILSDAAGTLTLSNVDALDATTETTIENAIDTLPNLTAAATLATVGTITTGTWQGDTIAVNQGGTGQTTYTNGQLLIGNTTGNTLTKATLTQGTGITVTNGTGSITIATTALLNVVEDTTPQLGGMLDVNGNAIGDGTLELLKFSETASAVNELTIKNAATGNAPELQATGDDSNVDLKLVPKGTGAVKGHLRRFMVRLLDSATAMTTGTSKGGDYRISAGAITIKAVGAYVDTAGTTGTATIDINEAGTTILSTKITIDTGEKSSETAATAPVISDSAIAADAVITFDVDAIHSGTAANGLVVWIDYVDA